ncbi:hypothetical protein [Comamonas composti]|uniref:hypothetical protein n=1 Tax=Comamonas composti TaxID=408558 RepID=UPI00047880B0|nr:hypothetical protein [Comamonas composti]
MTQPPIRSVVQGQPHRAAASRTGRMAERAGTASGSHTPTPLENAMALDLQTHWPTHRIRSFLRMQAR